MYATSRLQGIADDVGGLDGTHGERVHVAGDRALRDPGRRRTTLMGRRGPCFTGPTIPGCIGTDDDFDGYSYNAVYPDGQAKSCDAVAWSVRR